MKNIELQQDKVYEISDHLYGIFLEDIGFSVDGGLNANLINNYSFDGVYMNKETFGAEVDPLRYWEADCAVFSSGDINGLSENSLYARIGITGEGSLTNYGYHGGQHGVRPAITISSNQEYHFECWVRNAGFDGKIQIWIEDEDGTQLTTTGEFRAEKKQWEQVQIQVSGVKDGYGKFVISFRGDGELDLDCICFRSEDIWHPSDEKWRHGKLRRDLVETLQELHPAFMRFPGGCIVEGMCAGNEYNWKDTVGELWERKSNYSLWGESLPDGGYNQSYQIGFYEYFCLCEDLKMMPLPTLSAGINCQIRALQHKLEDHNIPLHTDAFQQYIVQNFWISSNLPMVIRRRIRGRHCEAGWDIRNLSVCVALV